MKRLISKTEAESLLAPHLVTITKCLTEAWSEWLSLRDQQLEHGNGYSARTRANIVYDNAAARAKSAFEGAVGVRVVPNRGFLLLVFDERVAVRFKKLRPNLASSGVPTRQQMLFAIQEELPGIPGPITYLIAGYVLDALQVRIERLVLTCSDARGLCWATDLAVSDESVVVPIGATAPFPAAPQVRSTLVGEGKRKESR